MSVWKPKNGKRKRNISQEGEHIQRETPRNTPRFFLRYENPVPSRGLPVKVRTPDKLGTAPVEEREMYLNDKIDYLLQQLPDFEKGDFMKENQIQRNLQEALQVASFSQNGELQDIRQKLGELEKRFNAAIERRQKPSESRVTVEEIKYNGLEHYGDWYKFKQQGMLTVLISKSDFPLPEAEAIADNIARDLKVGMYKEPEPYRLWYTWGEKEKPKKVDKGYRTIEMPTGRLVILINPKGEITLPTDREGHKVRADSRLDSRLPFLDSKRRII